MTQYANAQSNTTGDTALINKVMADFTNAWNNHDAKTFTAVFSKDAEFTNVRGERFIGLSEIETHHAPAFATTFKDSYLKITECKIRLIKEDVAVGDAWWEMTGIKGSEDQLPRIERGLMNFVATKNNNQWFIAVIHNMSLADTTISTTKNLKEMNLLSTRIITDDVQRLVSFYEHITGLAVIQFTPDFAEFKTEAAALAIGGITTMQFFGGEEVARPAQNRTVIVEFRVADVDETYERLKDFLTPYLVQKPTTMPWGNRSLLFRDPDGNLVNFFAPVTPEAIKRFDGA